LIGGIDIGHQESPSAAIPGESVRLRADRDLSDDFEPIWIDEDYLAGRPRSGENQPWRASAENAASIRATPDDSGDPEGFGINDIDSSEIRVRHKDSTGNRVHVPMVEGSAPTGRMYEPSPNPERADQES
jgi:hypothetical protein